MHDYDGLDEVVAQDNADYSEGKCTSQMRIPQFDAV